MFLTNEVTLSQSFILSIRAKGLSKQGKGLLNSLLARFNRQVSTENVFFSFPAEQVFKSTYLPQSNSSKGAVLLSFLDETSLKAGKLSVEAATVKDALKWLTNLGVLEIEEAEFSKAPVLGLSGLYDLLTMLFVAKYAETAGNTVHDFAKFITQAVLNGDNHSKEFFPKGFDAKAHYLFSAKALALASKYSVNSRPPFDPFRLKDAAHTLKPASGEETVLYGVGADPSRISKENNKRSSVFEVAPPSPGPSAIQRLIVFQVPRDSVEPNKLKSFLRKSFRSGLYVNGIKPESALDKRLISVFRNGPKFGFLEFSVLCEAGVETAEVISAMTECGALKKTKIHHIEFSYFNKATEGAVRISEWLSLAGSLYQEIGSLRSQRHKMYLAVVSRKL